MALKNVLRDRNQLNWAWYRNLSDRQDKAIQDEDEARLSNEMEIEAVQASCVFKGSPKCQWNELHQSCFSHRNQECFIF